LKEINRTDREEAARLLLDYELKKAELVSKPSFDKDHDRNKRITLKHNPRSKALIMDEATVPEFKEAVDIASRRIEDRNELVEGLFQTVKNMLINRMRDATVQTDVGCWYGAITYDYEQSTQKTEKSHVTEEDEPTFDDKVADLMFKKGFNINEESSVGI
jgi:hypothetical protein